MITQKKMKNPGKYFKGVFVYMRVNISVESEVQIPDKKITFASIMFFPEKWHRPHYLGKDYSLLPLKRTRLNHDAAINLYACWWMQVPVGNTALLNFCNLGMM